MSFVCADDFERKAQEKIEKNVLEFYKCGADEEFTLNLNREAFRRLRIRPRFLRDVSNLDLNSTLLGQKQKWPVGISPTSMQKLAHPEGEIANARAAGKVGSIFIMSSLSTTSIEDVAAAAPDTTKWFQLFIFKDRSLTEKLIRRCENAGYKAIVLTVDVPVLGIRRSDLRNHFKLPPNLSFENFKDAEEYYVGHSSVADAIEKGQTWQTVGWLIQQTRLPVLVKGVLTREDAILARECGCAGIIVSNHGARQLDTVPATIEALPEIAKAVGHKMLVMIDGGFRQGTDIFKAFALGAKYVFMGRPALWGLSCNGQQGVEDVLKVIKKELETSMALAGCRQLTDICKEMVVHESYYAKL